MFGYRVTMGNNLWITISAAGIPGMDTEFIWVQSNKKGEIPLSHELVQAIGQVLNESGIVKEDK